MPSGELLGPSEPHPCLWLDQLLVLTLELESWMPGQPPRLSRGSSKMPAHLHRRVWQEDLFQDACVKSTSLLYKAGGNNTSIRNVTGRSLTVWAGSLQQVKRAWGVFSRLSPRRGRDRHPHACHRVQHGHPGHSRPVTARLSQPLPWSSSAASLLTCLCFRHTPCLDPLPVPGPLFVEGSLLLAHFSEWVLGPSAACTVP